MKSISRPVFGLAAAALLLAGCESMNKTQKGAAVGTAGGAAVGLAIGSLFGKAGLGALIGAAVGGTAGTLIGKKMDQQAKEIEQTIPGAKVERHEEGIEVEFNNAILFGFDKSALSKEAKDELNKLATILVKYPDTNIEVQGHTDSKGDSAYNMKLSARRAQAVVDQLKTQNVAPERLKLVAHGENLPKYPNDTEENMAKNRRVEFLIYANEKMKAEAKKEAGEQ
ncbi:OmpA family protein [Flavihumibacter rivuli]|uniref:OmpA family protein n=1 Tax=Flavihumibacter rivuli TaxID=2838156 RepID=UPI001BDF1323|nr:OmpA family protein [Flavihumibacter rivuli]ULQ56600.1 OmpA family protein [Flavihumibacter rivuli]